MSTEGANRIFLRENPLVEKEFLKRLKRGDTTIELAEYLKTTKWPGSTVPASVSAFIQKTYPKENMQLLLDAGYTESEIKKMNPNKRIGLKDSIKSYRKILIPHLKKYDGTIESLVVDQVRDNTDIDYQLKKFRKETDPKVLKLLQKELGNSEFKPKIAQNQLNKLVESGGSDAIRIERSLTSRLLKEQPTKEAWAAGEKWISNNAPIYDDPDKMRKDFIKKFGKDHPLIKGIKTKYDPTKGFSAKFTEEVLGAPKGGMKLTKQNLRNIFSAAIYNFNDDVRDKILSELKIFAKKAAPTRYEARDRLQTPLLKKFNLNDKIHGPISRLILQDLGKDIYRDIQNNRAPRMDTIRHLQYLQKKVDPAYKKMFGETIKSLQFAQQKLWPEAKKQFNIAQNITFEHKIPQSLIDRGYADPIEYIKVVPTQKGFNEVKFRTFDKPLTNYIASYNKAAPEDKAKWLTKMNNLKDKFNKKFGNYLGDVRIEEVDGNIRLRSLGQAVTQETDLKSSLQAALKQEKGIIPQKFLESIVTNARAGGDVCELPMIKDKSTGGPVLKCVDAVNDALEKDPKRLAQEVNKSNAGGAFNKVKNSATKFLTALKENPNILRGSLGSKIALGLGTVAAGAGAGALVKQFRNDDPSTYLTNDSQMEGMIISDVEQKGEEVDDNILLDNQFKLELAGAAGLTAPIAKGVYRTARGVGEAGPLPEGVGRTRAALGLNKGVLGKGLWALGAPIIQVPSTLGYIAQDVREGKDVSEIATNPLNYLGAAFMNPSVKALAKAGASRGLLGIASLGLAGTAAGAVALPAISIGAGLATLGTLGYQGYKLFTGRNRSDGDFFR